MRHAWTAPTLLAVVLTVLNAAKPAVVDDTAYLEFARELQSHPGHPYDFEIFWYSRPKPAMQVLLPPVLPYALAAGRIVAGENLFLLKLTLFPFSLVLCHAFAFLARRFAPGSSGTLVAMTILGPSVLPVYGVMLDIPALALGLAAVGCFVHGCDRDRPGWIAVAGILAGLAAQTKYSMLPLPAVMLLYAMLSRNLLYGIAAGALAVAVFCGWESFVAQRHGESHFLFHLHDQQAGQEHGFEGWITEKFRLFQPMVGYLGGLAIGIGLLAGRGVGVLRGVLQTFAACGVLGIAAICVLPHSDSILLRKPAGGAKLDLPTLVFGTLGTGVLLAGLAASLLLLFRPRQILHPPRLLRWSRESWFLVGWLTIEFAAYFALTPFPAGRRVVGYCAVLALVAGRTACLTRFSHAGAAIPRWIAAFSIAAGLGLFALDTWDAMPERSLALRAQERIGPHPGETVWFQGHWGFQYYCGRAGWKIVEPGKSHLRPGDWLVFPVIPDPQGFYRPYHGGATFRVDAAATNRIEEFVWEDPLSAQTIPDLYGGSVPIRGRDHPRLRIAIYRVTRDWVPTDAEDSE